MIIGIVGAEEAKFTEDTKAAAIAIIIEVLTADGVTGFSSGHCHLGGIDIWAEEIGIDLGLDPYIYQPNRRQWDGGYKERNMKIGIRSDIVHCITVKELPPTYTGMRFPLCYHCRSTDHIKSGGCWTAKYAQRIGKPAKWWTV